MINGEVIAFALYFVCIIGVGVFFFFKDRHTNDEKEFFIGGRSMGPWVTAMSAQASDMSAWLLMGLPGSIMAFGFGQMWIGIGLALGTAANWILVATRLRKFSKAAGDAITLPQYLSNRFMTESHSLQVICAVIFFACFTVYVASGFVAGASVFTTVFPSLDTQTAMIIFAVAMLACTFFGGFKAVCWTDFFQGILMLVAVIAVPIVVVVTKEIDTGLLQNIYTYTDASTGEAVVCEFGTGVFDASFKEIANGLAWGLGYFGMPHILVRFMSIEKPSMVKKSATVAIIWVILSLGATCLIAYFGRMFLAEELLTIGAQKTVFITFARKLFPGFIAGLLMAAIIAASMSTADSQLLVASSSFTSDLYKPILRKNASEKEILWVGRIVVVIVSVIGFAIASSKAEGAQAIMNLVENAWAGFGSAFGPTIILSLFWRRFTYKGAVAGVTVGALVDVLWLAFMSHTGIYEIIPGFLCSLVAAVVVTLIDKAPKAEVVAIYDKATAKGFDEQEIQERKITLQQSKQSISEFLMSHRATCPVSFHMPGHKGKAFYLEQGYGAFLDAFMDCDITEINGADNLFQPEDIIKTTMEKYKTLYETRGSYLLINGSSGGILAAILSSVSKGGKLVMARNCHKSAFNALALGDITPVYAFPEAVEGYGILGEVKACEVARCLDENPEAEAVILPSPNYYGICSDIKAIAEVVHQRGKILIVDQAHGAHLKFFDKKYGFPKPAEEQGADIVINSIHKTLASFGQTALLNVCSSRANLVELEDKLQMIESSSPSYPMMASLDINADILLKNGKDLMRSWAENIEWFYEEAEKIPYLKVMESGSLDRTKLNLDMSSYGMTGHELEEYLMTKNIYPELVAGNVVMCMTGIGNKRCDYEKLIEALKELASSGSGKAADERQPSKVLTKTLKWEGLPTKKETVNIDEAAGRVCAMSIIPYPPGIPIACPGEVLDHEVIAYIKECRKAGDKVIGVSEDMMIQVGKN